MIAPSGSSPATSTAGPARHLLVMAKTPRAGMVKTRLCPPCSPHEAAAVAAAALHDTLDAVARCCAERKVLALAGEPGPWIPDGFEVVAQRGVGLAERLANAWVDVGGSGIQIGMDTPQVSSDDLDDLLELLGPDRQERPRAVLGPAADGGWWAIGLHGVDPHQVFTGIPMSTARTGAAQLARLRHLQLDVQVAETRTDLDTFEDLRCIVAAAPRSRTAGVVRRLGLLRDAA